MLYESPYLAHFGISGMKWGIRRYQNEDGTLTPEGKARYLKSEDDGNKYLSDYGLKKVFNSNTGELTKKGKKMYDASPKSSEFRKAIDSAKLETKYHKDWLIPYNESADEMNIKLQEINKKYKGRDVSNDPDYYHEVGSAWKQIYGKNLIKNFGEHPYIGRKWINYALFYDMYDEFEEEARRSSRG